MATWPHISAKNTTDVLQEGLPTGSEGGLYIAGFTKHRSQREPHSPGKNVMCRRWDTPIGSVAKVGSVPISGTFSLWTHKSLCFEPYPAANTCSEGGCQGIFTVFQDAFAR